MNKFLLFFIISFLLISIKSKSQDTILNNIDAKTYKLYNEKNWKELIKLSKYAIENGTDYYYLRMRLGIAYYKQHKYNLAYKQFKSAKRFDNNDLINEYLYYSYFFGGNYSEAEKLSKNFNENLKTKLGIKKPKKVISASASYLGLINDDYQTLKDIRYDAPTRYTLNNRVNNYYNYYYGADLKFRLNINYSSTISFGNFIQNKTQIIQNQDPIQNISSIEEFSNYTKQNNIYFNLVYTSLNFSWYAGLNFLNINDDYIDFVESEPEFIQNDVAEKYTDLLLNVGFNYKSTFFAAGLNGSASNLGSQRQLQIGGSFYLFPKANQNFIIYAMPYFQNISENIFIPQGRQGNYERTSLENNFVLKTGFSSLIYKSLFFETSAYFGNINQFNDNIAYLVFNDVGVITSLYSAKISFNLTKKLNFFVFYSYTKRKHEYQIIEYLFPPPAIVKHKQVNITNQNIIGGLIWSF
jgi:hypothetical protein